GALVSHTIRKLPDEENTKAAGLNIVQRLRHRVRFRAAEVECGAAIFDNHANTARPEIDRNLDRSRTIRIAVPDNVRKEFLKAKLPRKEHRLGKTCFRGNHVKPTLSGCHLSEAATEGTVRDGLTTHRLFHPVKMAAAASMSRTTGMTVFTPVVSSTF